MGDSEVNALDPGHIQSHCNCNCNNSEFGGYVQV
jgi:hypothetical protein